MEFFAFLIKDLGPEMQTMLVTLKLCGTAISEKYKFVCPPACPMNKTNEFINVTVEQKYMSERQDYLIYNFLITGLLKFCGTAAAHCRLVETKRRAKP